MYGGRLYSWLSEILAQSVTASWKSSSFAIMVEPSRSRNQTLSRAKILVSAEEMNKIEDGDVLIAVMTRPDYFPAMQKASAFVTDEGGITCHAAIVAREMKKPCVIGTKIATKIFKDGDIVEVDAEKGLVRKISL